MWVFFLFPSRVSALICFFLNVLRKAGSKYSYLVAPEWISELKTQKFPLYGFDSIGPNQGML